MIPREELLRVRRLASRANPRVKEWAELADKPARDRLGLTLAEGGKLAREALVASGYGFFRPRALLVSDAGSQREEAGELFRLAGEMGIERFSLTDDCLAKVSGMRHAEGLALVLAFDPAATAPVDMFSNSDSRWIVAAGVQDPGNAGALARIALAVGATGCVFLDGADPRSPKFLRGGMGAAFRLPCLSLTADAFAPTWKKSGTRLVAAAASSGATDFRSVDYLPPLGIMIGGERGIPDHLLALATETAHIPLRGGVESLNLAVAAGVILFEAEKAWSARGL